MVAQNPKADYIHWFNHHVFEGDKPMADIPAAHIAKPGKPSDQRIASALETIAKAQIAQAEDLRDLCRLVAIVANKMK